jgi:hypothetical protein
VQSIAVLATTPTADTVPVGCVGSLQQCRLWCRALVLLGCCRGPDWSRACARLVLVLVLTQQCKHPLPSITASAITLLHGSGLQPVPVSCLCHVCPVPCAVVPAQWRHREMEYPWCCEGSHARCTIRQASRSCYSPGESYGAPYSPATWLVHNSISGRIKAH